MTFPLLLASGSSARAAMLASAGVAFEQTSPRVDEAAILESLSAEGASARDIADKLAEAKAIKVSQRSPGRTVIGADQVLETKSGVLQKPKSREEAAGQLKGLAGTTHTQWSAAVICEDGSPIWRIVDRAVLHMRPLTGPQVEMYLDRNWPAVADSVGAYHFEAEGVRLFTRADGSAYTIRGFPLMPVVSFLIERGSLDP